MFVTNSYLAKIRTMPLNEFETIQKTVEAIEGIVKIRKLDFCSDSPKRAQFCLWCEGGIKIQKVNIDEYSDDEYFLQMSSPHRFAPLTFHITLGNLPEAVRIAVALQKYWDAFAALDSLPLDSLTERRQIGQKAAEFSDELASLESF